MEVYDPANAYACHAAGGIFPERFIHNESRILIEVPHEQRLVRLFAHHVLGGDCDTTAHWSLLTPAGHHKRLVSFTIHFHEIETELRLLFWADQHSQILEWIAESKSMTICTSEAMEAALSGLDHHPECISFPLDVDNGPLLAALAPQPLSTIHDDTGWSFSMGSDEILVRVAAKDFLTAEVAVQVQASLKDQFEHGLISFVDGVTVRVAGLPGLVSALSSALSDAPAHDLSETEAINLFTSFQRSVVQEVSIKERLPLLRPWPKVSTLRVAKGNTESENIYFVATVYTDEAESLRVYEILSGLPEASQHYVARLHLQNPNRPLEYLVFAFAYNFQFKDSLCNVDWGDGTFATTEVGKEYVVQFLSRAVSRELASDDVRVVPPAIPLP